MGGALYRGVCLMGSFVLFRGDSGGPYSRAVSGGGAGAVVVSGSVGADSIAVEYSTGGVSFRLPWRVAAE